MPRNGEVKRVKEKLKEIPVVKLRCCSLMETSVVDGRMGMKELMKEES